MPQCPRQTVNIPRNSVSVSVQLRYTDAVRPGSFRILSYRSHGTLDKLDLANGTFTYTHSPGYVGTDSLTFVGVAVGNVSEESTVTFDVA